MVFDTKRLTVLATIPVGRVPIRLAISPDGRTAVTSNYGAGDLTLIDVGARKVRATLPVSGSTDAAQVTIAFSPDGKRLYVAETAAARVAEVDLASGKVLRRLVAGKGSDGLGLSPVDVSASR
jgi:DNA-binding beta-propeller fold protein YncE